MSPKVVPAPGTPAAEMTALAARELALAEREAQLLDRSFEIEGVARDTQARLDAVRAALQRLANTRVHGEAETTFMKSLSMVVPAHTASDATAKAFALRRDAAAAREQALKIEEAAVHERVAELSALDQAINTLQQDADKLTAKSKEPEPLKPKPPPPPPPVELTPKAPPPPPAEAAPPPAAKAPPPPPEERQHRHTRIKLQTEVSLHSESNFFTGFTGDISETGVFVATYEHVLEPGTPVELKLTLPGRSTPIAVHGVVKWVRELHDTSPGLFPGMGIGFDSVSPQEQQAIKAFVQQREPMFWVD